MIKMQVIKTIGLLVFLFYNNTINAQSIFFTNGSRENLTIDRLAVKNATVAPFILGNIKPYNRAEIISHVLFQDSVYQKTRIKSNYNITAVDQYNYAKLLWNNPEYLEKIPDSFISKKPFLNYFYKSKANLYEVREKDFRLVINPVIQQVQSVEMNNKKRVYLNAKGFELKGILGNKIGFYAYVTDNQENGPSYYEKRVDSIRAVHGAGFYKPFKYQPNGTSKGQDYFDYRGYITFKLAKLINVQYGYDKNFIGNGYRSLFLSDQSAPMLFMKLNTKIWKLDYTNLFMELAPTTLNNNGSAILQKKFAAMHHLTMNFNENLSIGLFESVIFKRRSQFEFGYLVPVIFYRAVESGLGSGDNALIGADFKANVAEKIQLYGQVILDEFNLKEIRKKSASNKVGIQAGMKYFDVADIDNLDLQFEWNIVRPYTYSHTDSATTYTHYNQPLAHPLGANFSDVNAIVRYQPKPRLFFETRLMYARQGQDSTLNDQTGGGGNIFRTYTARNPGDVTLITNSSIAQIINFNFLGSYEIRPNLYLESNLQFRSISKDIYPRQTSAVLSVGVRWNMNRRDFDY